MSRWEESWKAAKHLAYRGSKFSSTRLGTAVVEGRRDVYTVRLHYT